MKTTLHSIEISEPLDLALRDYYSEYNGKGITHPLKDLIEFTIESIDNYDVGEYIPDKETLARYFKEKYSYLISCIEDTDSNNVEGKIELFFSYRLLTYLAYYIVDMGWFRLNYSFNQNITFSKVNSSEIPWNQSTLIYLTNYVLIIKED